MTMRVATDSTRPGSRRWSRLVEAEMGGRGIEQAVIREASEAPVVDGDHLDAEPAEAIDRRGRNVLAGEKSQTARSCHESALGCEIRVPADRVRREAYRRKHILARDAVFLDYFVDGEATADLVENELDAEPTSTLVGGRARCRDAGGSSGLAARGSDELE